MKRITVSLLIFTRNEIDGLQSIFNTIPFESVDEVIAIDGHSTDGTIEFLQSKNIKVVSQTKLGRGNAAIEGIAHCSGEIVVFLSADGNENPLDIPKLIDRIRDSDIAVASRFLKGASSDDSDDPIRIRKFGNRLVTALVNLLWGAHVTDSTNGLRAIRRTSWERLAIDSPYHETEFQMTIRAAKLGMRIAEIPTVEGRRVGGTRYASTRKMAWTFLNCLLREIWIGKGFTTSKVGMKNQVRAHYNAISSFYQRRKRDAYLRLVKNAIGPIPSGRIADLGCGTGYALSWFQGEKIGVDFSPELLRQGSPGPEYIVADVEVTPFRNESFESVLCLDVIEHLPSLKVIDEAHRILVPDGVFHLSTADSKFEVLLEVLEKLKLKLPEGPHQWRKTGQITTRMQSVGFTCEHRLKAPIRFYRAVKAANSTIAPRSEPENVHESFAGHLDGHGINSSWVKTVKINIQWKGHKDFIFSMSRPRLIKLGLVSIPFIIAVAAFFWQFSSLGLSHWDEYLFIGTAARMDPSIGWGHLFPYDPPLFPLLLLGMFRQFGFRDYVAVATSGILAFLLCTTTFLWVNRQYDLRTAVISTSILASTELFILYARMALSDMAFTFFFSLAMFAYFHAIKAQRGWTYIVAGIMLMLAMATKYNGFQPILIAAIFVLPFHVIAAGNRNRPFAEKFSRVSRAILHTFSGLWLSTIPAIIFVVLFLAFLGKPFEINDFRSMLGALSDLPPRVSEGLAYFMRTVYPLKTVVNRTQLFSTVNFYSRVLTNFITAPILLLSLIGAIRGLIKRNAQGILLIIWFSFVFVYFASIPSGFVRVILPAVVPIAILSGYGLVWVLSHLDRYLRKLRMPVLRKRGFRMLVKLGLVLIVLTVNLLYAAPAITNTHSAYRIAAEIIAKNVPDGKLIWWATQPVLITELYLMGRNYRFSDNVTQLDQADIVVLDFRAQLYHEYPIVLSQISHMQLVAIVRNDVPVVNLLDSFDFSQLNQVLANKDTMSIRIYSRTPLNPQLSGAPFSIPHPSLSDLVSVGFEVSVSTTAFSGRISTI